MNPNSVTDGKGEPDGLPFFVPRGLEAPVRIVGEYPSTRYRKYVVGVGVITAIVALLAWWGGARAAVLYTCSAGALLALGMVINLCFELRAPRSVRIEGSELIAEWRVRTVRWPLPGLRVERKVAELILEKGTTRITNGSDAFYVFSSLTNRDRILEIIERSGRTSQ